MWRSNYLPPATRLLWRLGIDARPPHFLGFWQTALSLGLLFSVFWGGLMWLIEWRDKPFVFILSAALVAGAVFGLAIGAYYAAGRRKYALPRWDDLPGGQAPR